MRCANCGEENPDSGVNCASCGELLLDIPAAGEQPTGLIIDAGTAAGDVATAFVPSDSIASAASAGSFPQDSMAGGMTGSRPLPVHARFANRYEILALLGEGGMGRVYKARDVELDRVIALKTIRVGEDNPEVVQRFKQELVLARKITHRNVIRIHDLGEAEGVKFFTMECVDGKSLKQIIREKKGLSVDETLRYARQILGALEEAHRQSVVHRDLKPQNIMVDADGTPYVMDFGIARATDTTGMTATGMVVGTPDYMSPEQVKGEKATAQADLFSFGVILYEMLTGDLPYQSDTPVGKVMARLTQKPRPPRELKAEIPKYLDSVVLKCLEPDTELRYRSAGEILQDLDRTQVDRSLTIRFQRAVVRSKLTVAAALIAATAVGAAVYFAVRGTPAVADPAADVPVRTLAILPLTNAAGAPELEWMRTGLAEMLVTDISQSQYVRPVSTGRLAKVLGELGIAEQTRFDETALDKVAELAPAESVLHGQFVQVGTNLRVDLTLRKAGSALPVPLKAEGSADDVFALVDQITGLIKGQLDLTDDQLRSDTDRPVSEVSTASIDALRSYEAGVSQLQQGASQAAIPLLREATEKDGDFAMAFAKLAAAHQDRGEQLEAEAAIDRAVALLERNPLPDTERYQIRATAAVVKGDMKTASEAYGELARLHPQDPDIQFQLADSLESLGELPEALAAYDRVLASAPDYGAALMGRGRVLIMSGKMEDSAQSLEQALKTGQFDKNPEALGLIHSILGVAYRELGKYDDAIQHLNQSIEIRRNAGDRRGEAASFSNLGTVYYFQGQIDQALQANQTALEIAREMGDTDSESAYLQRLGLIYKDGGRLDEALASLEEAVQIEMARQDTSGLGGLLNNVADIYRAKGRFGNALVYLEQARTLLKDSDDKTSRAFNLMSIGQVRQSQGLYEPALESLLAAAPLFSEIQNASGEADVHLHVSEIYAAQGRYADAFKGLQQAAKTKADLKANGDLAEVKAHLAEVLLAVGLTDAAQAQLEEAERLAAESGAKALEPLLTLTRARLADQRGDRERAAQAYTDANVKANLSGQKEIAVESRVELSRLYRSQGRLDNAERLLERTLREASQARLQPLEAQASAALAEVYMEGGKADAAQRSAREAIRFADRFSGRPVLARAYGTLGQASAALGQDVAALDAWTKAAETLEWIRGSLLPEHVEAFTSRPDVHALAGRAIEALEKGGRTAEAAPLKAWNRPAAAAAAGSP